MQVSQGLLWELCGRFMESGVRLEFPLGWPKDLLGSL